MYLRNKRDKACCQMFLFYPSAIKQLLRPLPSLPLLPSKCWGTSFICRWQSPGLKCTLHYHLGGLCEKHTHAHGRTSGLAGCARRLLNSALLFSLFKQHFHHSLMNEFSSRHCADDVFICCVSASILFIVHILSTLLWSLFTLG